MQCLFLAALQAPHALFSLEFPFAPRWLCAGILLWIL